MLFVNSGPHCKSKLSRELTTDSNLQGLLLDLQSELLLSFGLLLETHLRFMVRKLYIYRFFHKQTCSLLFSVRFSNFVEDLFSPILTII